MSVASGSAEVSLFLSERYSPWATPELARPMPSERSRQYRSAACGARVRYSGQPRFNLFGPSQADVERLVLRLALLADRIAEGACRDRARVGRRASQRGVGREETYAPSEAYATQAWHSRQAHRP